MQQAVERIEIKREVSRRERPLGRGYRLLVVLGCHPVPADVSVAKQSPNPARLQAPLALTAFGTGASLFCWISGRQIATDFRPRKRCEVLSKCDWTHNSVLSLLLE
jgi:hypothetical protein